MADAERRQQKTETLATLYVGKLRLECRNGAPKIFARPLYASLSADRRSADDAGEIDRETAVAKLCVVTRELTSADGERVKPNCLPQ